MKIFKNKGVVIGIIVVLILVLVGGVYLFFANRAAQLANEEEEYIEEIVAEEIAPEEIDLTMEANESNKAVRFLIGKASGITSIEYQVFYEADSTAAERSEGGADRVQRGITGTAEVAGGSSFESEWLDLGSCSKNVCRYDSGVTEVTLTLKVVKDDGKVYQVEQTLEL
ncbi:MAG TPA: hypothetical protein VLF20_00500 [Patescibacteria group bacterium]|nr:hypothetical protein [Patescibacteria group bacterium]